MLFEIHFKVDSLSEHYLMDQGPFAHEQEVVLMEGIEFQVTSVTEERDLQGKKMTLISLSN